MEKSDEANLYISLIGECRKEVDSIRMKVSILTSPQVETVSNETPSRTELESALKGLLSKIKELKGEIIV